MHARFRCAPRGRNADQNDPYRSLLRFEKLISFNIKNLELYIEQDSFNELKGVIYGMGSSSRSSVVRVVSAVVKRSPK